MRTAFFPKRSSYALPLLVCGILGLDYSKVAQAQVVPDTTLGNEASVVLKDTVVRGAFADLIEGGAVRGANVFHSFSDFNIGELQRVYFSNPVGIENILSRVTGNNPSDLLGTLGVDGNANLFFLNPNGITFGPNSQLDITGSFFASTAEAFDFGDGLLYGVTDPAMPPLLEVTLTPGLQYGANQRAIENSGNVSVGGDFTLASDMLELSGQLIAGGDLTLQAEDTVGIRDSAEQSFVAAAGDELLVQGNELVDIFALNHPDSGLFSGGDMLLRSPNSVIGDAHYYSGGNFSIQTLDQESGDLHSPEDPVIFAIGDVAIGDYIGGSLHVLAGGGIGLGNITINAEAPGETISPNNPILAGLASIELSDGNSLVINGAARPTLDVRAGIDWNVFGGLPNSLADQVFPSNAIPPNDIAFQPATSNGIIVGNIDAKVENSQIFITNRFNPNLELPQAPILVANIDTSRDTGQAGSVTIDALGNIIVEPFPLGGISNPEINTFISQRNQGFAGNITLLSETGIIDTTLGPLNTSAANGIAGNITLKAEGDVNTNEISSFVGASGVGISGTIEIISREGNIDTTAGKISAAVDQGIGGSIKLEAATGNVTIGDIESFSNGVGNGGSVRIVSGDDFLLSGNSIVTGALGQGRGGNVDIEANVITLRDRALINADSRGSGQGGSITLQPQSLLQIVDGSEVLTRAFSNGLAGDILIMSLAPNQQLANVTIQGVTEVNPNNLETVITDAEMRGIGLSSGLFSTSEAREIQNPGQGGNIQVTGIGNLTISDGGVISGRTRSSARGGKIEVDVEEVNITGGGQILSTTFDRGQAEDISIIARSSVNIEGANDSYDNQSAQIRDFYFNDLFNGQNFNEALFEAVEKTEEIVSPVSAFSGIQASDQAEFEAITNDFGFSSFVPIITSLGAVGEAGSIEIKSPMISILDQGLVLASALSESESGSITLNTNALSLQSGGAVQTSTFGRGDGGDIIVTPLNSDLPSSILISGTADINIPDPTNALPFPRPTGGYSSSLITTTESLDVGLLEDPFFNFSQLPQSNGQGGDIRIQGFDVVEINNGGTLNARSRGGGNAGRVDLGSTNNVDLRIGELILTDGGQVITAGYRSGRAGVISVNTIGDINISGIDISFTERSNDLESAYASQLAALFESTFLQVPGIDFSRFIPPGEDLAGQTPEAFVARNFAESRAPLLRDFFIGPVDESSGLQAQAGFQSLGSGAIGVDSINGSLLLSSSARVDSNNFGVGDSLGILIDVNNRLVLEGGSSISSAVLANDDRVSPIDGGLISIEANSLSMQNSELAVSTFGLGNSGNISLVIEDSLKATDSSSIRSTVEDTGIGQGGDVVINTTLMEMLGGSQITAGVFREGRILTDPEGKPMVDEFGDFATAPGGQGDGGDIIITATDSIVLSGTSLNGLGSGFLTPTEEGAKGNAGRVFVATPELEVSNSAVISANTANSSNAGGVELRIGNLLTVSNGGLISVDGALNTNGGPGEPGNIIIRPLNLETPVEEFLGFEPGDRVPALDPALVPKIELNQGGKIQARTNSTDSANIQIVGENLTLSGTRTFPFNANTCSTCNDISASAEGNNATGGNVSLRLNAISADRNESSDIAANAVGEGGGGRIKLLLLTDAAGRIPFDLNAMFRLEEGRSIESDLDASSELGIQGSVEVGEATVVESVDVPIPLDPTELVNRSCELQASNDASEFRIVGRGGLPITPRENLNEETLIEDLGPPIESSIAYQDNNDAQTITSSNSAPIEIISEPQGWARTPEGRLVLYSAASSTSSPIQLDTTCASASEQYTEANLL